MPLLAAERLLRSVESGERGGVFFLFGDEEYLKDELATRLVQAHLEPATRDFNYDQLRGGEITPEALASVIQTPPMMAAWRVVVVRDAQALATSAALRDVVEGALERPAADLALILLTSIPSGSKAQFYERLKRGARAVDFPALGGADLPGWLMERARADGLTLEPAAARALAAAIPGGLAMLMPELAKLREFVGERARITIDDVQKVVGPIARQNRWEWFDMVGNARFAEARRTLPILLESGESGVGLVIGLGAQLLRLAIVSTGGERALQAELPPNQKWLARRITGQAKRWSPALIDAALDDLFRADRLLKSASLTDRQVLEEALLRMDARAAPTA
ncbi:MAG: DNA polymerase III subunit delta [Longimicrobiales bacterium]